jgi:fatty-acyl-CoA synthase
MFHVNAAINCLLGLLLGMTTVVAGPAGFRTAGVRENFLKILATQRISYFSAVPTIFAALLQQPDIKESLSSVRFAISAAAALPLEVMRAFTEKTGIRILEGYGQTEATVATCLNPYMGTSKPGSVGLRLPYAKVKTALIGEDNQYLRDCAPNEIGHLLVAGDHVSIGYLNPQHNQNLWVRDTDGMRWLNSGDLARIDDEGYVWLTGRAKELIIRGGHNIDPRMIEEALQSHPDVVMAAAVGQPDRDAGEVPVAYVTLAAGAQRDVEALLRYAAQHIPERAACPKSVRVVDELPLTAIGKVFKPRLVKLEHEAAYRQALQALRPWFSSFDVEVESHPEHGLLAQIRLGLKDENTRDRVTRMVAEIMGAYAARYSVHFITTPFEEEAVAA